MFHSTRLKLTAWYLLIIMAISISFSAFIYFGSTREYDRLLRIEQYRIQHPTPPGVIIQRPFGEIDPFSPPPSSHVDNELIEWARIRVLEALFGINVVILFLSALSGYFLAGRTLRPIKNMLDEQNRFITDASHELNTPLTSLKTSIEVNLRDKNFNTGKAKEVLESNLEDVNNLQFLSAELIKLTQYQEQNNKLQFEKIYLSDVIQEAVEKVKAQAKKKNISISSDTAKIYLTGEKRSLTELFIILLDNAIKYSSNKTIVKVMAKKIDSKVQVVVKDNGMGIEKKDLPYIFDRFYRADKSRTKQKTKGYGLGLSIAKRITILHNGNITVESETGKGSSFIVILPRV
jgi:two-component system sensor histidine kinase CiaH